MYTCGLTFVIKRICYMLCYAFCVGVRPAVALLRPTHSDAERTSRVVGPTQFTPPARHDKTVLSVSLLVCRCELDDCCERAQTLYFLSATVLSCREYNSHRRNGRDTDNTILLTSLSRSRVEWRCELALTLTVTGSTYQ